jgi:hypothetical protein
MIIFLGVKNHSMLLNSKIGSPCYLQGRRMKWFKKILTPFLFLNFITGCFSGHGGVYPSYPKREELVKKMNDSTFSIDLKSQMAYGEFCNIIADKNISGCQYVKRTNFSNFIFVMDQRNQFKLKTYFPSSTIKDSSYFFLATPGSASGTFGGNKYLLQFESERDSLATIKDVQNLLNSKYKNTVSNKTIVLLATEDRDMKDYIVPSIKALQNSGFTRVSFSIYKKFSTPKDSIDFFKSHKNAIPDTVKG